MRIAMAAGLALLLLVNSGRAADAPPPLARGVRGLATKAPGAVAVDGKLTEWAGAFVTPVHYSHVNLEDRAAQFLYMWDDRALYIGLRALDRHRANLGEKGSLWNGDAVEFYLDTRPGGALRGKDWSDGAIHLFYTPFEGRALKPRWEMRPGIATSGTVLQGVEIAATEHEWGYEVEFAIPWANFPQFTPKAEALLAIDAELCSGDGAGRTDRTFAYGSPLSVQQPASLGLIELVEADHPSYLLTVGASACPMWVETPWLQPTRARSRAVIAIPPALAAGKFNVRVSLDEIKFPDNNSRNLSARIEGFGPAGLGFTRAVADWPIDDFAPGTFFAVGIFDSSGGDVLATVAPRMVQEAQMSGR